MGFTANGSWTIDTFGDLIELGSGFSANCDERPGCGQNLDLDVYDMAIQFGRRAKFVDRKFPIVCKRCGSRNISFRLSPQTQPKDTALRGPPQNFRSSRTALEREALAVVFPRRKEWPER